ncbi:hypothetical protein C1645_820931 [Glomus cerebriforme]|uniref:F-box domain-containing protein n=1 Tax=Glomus cerebriforme TaxID=658196 RepID=A0A397T7M9_9GLOM|nr:hypothetical protein C1645_820931 [Glomus cerebriforme]
MSKLNSDILYHIFQELNKDRNSLFSCLLVNKLWCELTVPILWKCPSKYFDYRDDDAVKRCKDIRSIFNIITLHLSENSRKFLLSQHIYIFSIFKQQRRKLSLNYVSFYYNIPIYKYPGANTCLSNLCELRCNSDNNPSIFEGLAQICRSIETIFINMIGRCYRCNDGLTKLILIQKQIKYITIRDFSSTNHDCKELTKALEKQAHSILYLNMSMGNNFSQLLYSEFINLETLLLYGCCKSVEKNLVTAVYSKLQILELYDISLYITTKIIQNTNGNLWKVKIEYHTFNYSREYIQTIYKYCPNIKYASVYMNNQNLDELENFLINCQHLEAIDVITNNVNGDKFLDMLLKFSSSSKRKTLHLYIRYDLYNWKYHENFKIEGVVIYSKGYEDFWHVDN